MSFRGGNRGCVLWGFLECAACWSGCFRGGWWLRSAFVVMLDNGHANHAGILSCEFLGFEGIGRTKAV
jgi:hypothetical protein